MKKSSVLSLFLVLAFFIFASVIAFYILIEIANIPEAKTTVSMVFEAISFIWLLFLFIIRFKNPKMLIGFFVPAIMVDLIHIVIITAINYNAYRFSKNSVFLMIHMVLLFVNLIITVPFIVFGIKED